MYDIKPLEEQWVKYKRKQRRPLLMTLFTISLVLVLSLSLLNYKESDFLMFTEKDEARTAVDRSNALLLDRSFTTLETKRSVGKAKKPLLLVTHNRNAINMVEELPVSADMNVIKEPRVAIETVQKPKKKIDINITKTTSVDAYKDVEKRFYQSHDADDSLFLAKNYYSQKAYKKAEYWALQTNKVDGNIEESWLIFAKSKVKRGQKSDAIRVLTAYIKKSNSVKAKALLNKIKKDTL